MNDILQKKSDILSLSEIEKIAAEFSKAVERRSADEIAEILRNKKVLKSLIVGRGKEGRNFKLILDGFEILLNSENVKLDKDAEKILDVMNHFKISTEVAYLFAEAAFHLRESAKFEKISKIILDQKDKVGEKAFYYMLHTDASWKEVQYGDSKKALEENMEVIGWAKENDPILYLKAKFGLTYNKELLPKQKAQDSNKIADEMQNQRNMADAFRVKSEAARSYLDLAKQQGIDDIAFENLEQAKEIALEALKIAKSIGYPNLEINASEVLEGIYAERMEKVKRMKEQIGKKSHATKEFTKQARALASTYKDDARKSKSFHDRAEKLRKEYDYKTIFNKKYKSTHFSHI